MRNFILRGVSAIFVWIVLSLAVDEAGAGMIIMPHQSPKVKAPSYAAIVGKNHFTGDRITVDHGPKGLLNVTIHNGTGKKIVTSSFVDFGNNRILPAPQKGIMLNGDLYSSAVFKKPNPGGSTPRSPQLKTTDYEIVPIPVKKDVKKPLKDKELKKFEAEIGHSHHSECPHEENSTVCKKFEEKGESKKRLQ